MILNLHFLYICVTANRVEIDDIKQAYDNVSQQLNMVKGENMRLKEIIKSMQASLTSLEETVIMQSCNSQSKTYLFHM